MNVVVVAHEDEEHEEHDDPGEGQVGVELDVREGAVDVEVQVERPVVAGVRTGPLAAEPVAVEVPDPLAVGIVAASTPPGWALAGSPPAERGGTGARP